jgi:SIT4-associating protein SAP185/190
MFWRFGGYQSIPTINSLLDRPNVTVEEVLDEADLLQELKENNTKLIEYLRDEDVLKHLLDYIVSPSLVDEEDEYADEDEKPEKRQKDKCEHAEKKEASDDGTEEGRSSLSAERGAVSLSLEMTPEEREEAERARLKYAYMASEVLSAPTWSIIEAITLHETALRDFWHFLWCPAPLSAVQTNYFVKVNEVLLDKKPMEMISFVMSLDGIVGEILHHVDNPLIMDLLLKIISLDRVTNGMAVTEVSG